MKETLLNHGWRFHLEDEAYRKTGDPMKKDELTMFGFWKTGEASGPPARRYEDLNWRTVDLPHDYVIELPHEIHAASSSGLKPVHDCCPGEDPKGMGRMRAPCFPIAWYRKEFFLSEEGEVCENAAPVWSNALSSVPDGKRFFLRFEGVYRDFILWVNGVYMDRVTCGYLGVTFDVTDQLIPGQTNTVAVRVDCSQSDGWWYDGGGIYRDVKLLSSGDCFCHKEELYVHTAPDGRVEIDCELKNLGAEKERTLSFVIKKDGKELCRKEQTLSLRRGANAVSERFLLPSPALWDVDDPQLYSLHFLLDGEEEVSTSFGFKDVRFDPDEGFFLNGRSLRINGVSLHQDFAGVGIALPYEVTYYKYKAMKEMGANAVRTAHNPPSPDVLDICDRLGLLLMDETRLFGSSPEALRQITALVKRDRNHPCLLLWSIGNEEHTAQNTLWGQRMARTVKETIRSLTKDPLVTYGGNNSTHYEGINAEMDVRGVNYIRISRTKHPDDYHSAHPEQPMLCSEECSSMTARSIYKNDQDKGYVDAYGHNCLSWGSTPEGYLKFREKRPYLSGAFLWTGCDYHGEAAPFGGNPLYPDKPRNTVCNYGMSDLCAFPKDNYYYLRAHWREEPLLHLLPHWHFEEGEEVRVVAYTNCEEVTLYLNGRLLSTQYPAPLESPEWRIAFEAGELKAVGKKGDRTVTAVRRSTDAAALRIHTESCGDYTFAAVDAVDSYGEICTVAKDLVSFSCEGAEIVAVGNGDPTARLREKYFAEEETKKLPPLKATRTPPPAHYRPFEILTEEPKPRFEEKFRMVWQTTPVASDEYEFTAEFEADESYRYLEFGAIRGESTILLNGKEIGRTPEAGGFTFTRPYRFFCDFDNGTNRLTVKTKVEPGNAAIVEDALIGKPVTPKVSHPLFGGRLLLILRHGKRGSLKAFTETGLCAEAIIDPAEAVKLR